MINGKQIADLLATILNDTGNGNITLMMRYFKAKPDVAAHLVDLLKDNFPIDGKS